jgi:hypothetical protein
VPSMIGGVEERKHEALATVRLVNKDADAI